MKLRPGDQQLPVVNEYPAIQDLVIADIEERREIGISRYGTALQPFNGRDALRDLYEELLDGASYVKQVMVERDARSIIAESDIAERAHKAAEDHLDACWEALDAWEHGDSEVTSLALDAFCGCQTCVVREVLYAVWDIVRPA